MTDERIPLLVQVAPRTRKPLRMMCLFILPCILLLFALCSWYKVTHHLGPEVTVRIYTNNIRYDNRNHPDEFEQPWKKRRVQSINSMDFHSSAQANVVCLQEVLHHQLNDILDKLNKHDEWTYYGVGRSDGITRGEYAPILYKKSEWRVVQNTTYWLSETPWKPSRGWDAALERIVTMITLQSYHNPLVKINVFNTHYDHRGKVARRESSKLIVNKMQNFNTYPSFLCGDFNTEPKDEPYHILTKAGFKDARKLVNWDDEYGHSTTFTGFNKEHEADSIIDYIWSPYFTRSDEVETESINYFKLNHHRYYDIVLRQFGILHNYFKGFYFSDHRPVVATYIIRRIRLF
ncbi:uncharacterized protein SPAPADRAFT_58854 [Spathaspora passalidarum NRRL Y-27907]|uniref:Endonuclease/exonuclease/phosphatase domain-containing protein n=1 Tax=Spathaspora passalidarum (strain NRRL Y-27907 / 11-Y1) TaxID=619300 RepID=G3AEB3_SPAPN|nr:uncharacterized protein SPAPADRAFT_58854 [Spathaspora passalidarum NRRL Y-27907]EGW35647.1 hypothetical protein SPAPADRAFT_58854 [Spathaspora passalidarum NRRL Y-27907]